MIIVSDTGLLNYLVLIGRIDFLNRLFGTVVVPFVVIDELTNFGSPELVREWANSLPNWVEVHNPKLLPPDIKMDGRGKGERAAIALAIELNAPILWDDRQARNIARREGLIVSGTLGVLQEAHARGIDEIDLALDDFVKTNYFLSEGQIEKIISSSRLMRMNRGNKKGDG